MDPVDALSRDDLLLLVRDLLQVNGEQQGRIRRLEEEVALLKGGGPPPSTPRETPFFVKPNRKRKDVQEPKPPRKQRPHGFARRRETPTRVVPHEPKGCSSCGHKLSDGWVHSSRQVIEIPMAPVEVIEHQFWAGHCGVCNRPTFARPDLSDVVWGKSRLGVGLMSLIGYLDVACRMPVRTIQSFLSGVYGLKISQGQIVEVSHKLAQAGQGHYEELLSEVRQSPVVQADETGAREDGINGYVWSLSTPDIRFYHRDQSRGAAVIQELLGYEPSIYQARSAKAVRLAKEAARSKNPDPLPRFKGKLVTDFYCAYHWYPGFHQCCLVHLDRDLDELKADHAKDPAVCDWVDKVLDLIYRAKDYDREQRENPTDRPGQRLMQRRLFEKEAENLARPYCTSALPQRVLAQRLRKHLGQLFVFVEHPDVPSDNNGAERAIRPFVVLRKVSGGTRSPAGSKTQAVLLSLFGTWLLRGEDALVACRQMLTGGAVPAPT